MVLPKLETIRPELLAKIKELLEQGAVILEPRPSRSPSLEAYPASDKSVQDIAAELWGKIDGSAIKVNRYGKGLVISDMELQEALNTIKVLPDLKITQSDSILFIHRALNDGDILFLIKPEKHPC